MLTITLKNYRAFSDSNPLVIELGPQFTALVGPNNSGKSSFLLAIYELRNLWNNLIGGALNNLIGGQAINVSQYLAVEDPIEIFNNSNSRPISIELMITPSTPGRHANKLVLNCSRDSPTIWTGHAYIGGKPLSLGGYGWNPAQKVYFRNNPRDEVSFGPLIDELSILANVLYVGPFRSIIGQVSANYYDLEIGANFIKTWNTWKSGPGKAANNAIGAISQNILEIFKFSQLEINAQSDGSGLHVRVDGKPYRLAELGAGLAQFIITFANAAIKKPKLILIDEPELHLHPTLQLSFLSALASYAANGVAFATHSLGLARSVADRIYAFRKLDGNSVIRPFERTAGYAEFLGEMSFNSFKDLGYDSILLVEGVNDVRTVQQWLRLLDKDNRVVVFPLHGNELAAGGREVELGEIRRLSENIFALVDSERTSEAGPPDANRTAFAKICEDLKIKVCITKYRSLENYLSDRAIKAAFGDQFSVLPPYLRVKDVTPNWGKPSSWRAAQIMSKEELSGTDVFQFLEAI